MAKYLKFIKIMNEANEKSIVNAIYNDQVRQAFNDFVALAPQDDWVIIGGIAMGVWTPSRNTSDVDILASDESVIDAIYEAIKSKFKRHRKHAFEHKATGVEIECITPNSVKISHEIAFNTIDKAKKEKINGKQIKIATPKYLILLKLARAVGKGSKPMLDRSDIIKILEIYGDQHIENEDVKENEIELYKALLKDSKNET